MSTQKYIYITKVPTPTKRKTGIFEVFSFGTDFLLGKVSWYSRWRRYAFFPQPGTVFEQECLRDIAMFCEMQTNQHRAYKEQVDRTKILRNKLTEENRKFWDAVERDAAEARKMPEWKRAGVNGKRPCTCTNGCKSWDCDKL